MLPRRNRDNLLSGLLIGLLVPFVGYALLLVIYEQLEAAGALSSSGFTVNFRQRTVALVAICLNLIPLSYFQRRYMNRSLRGLVLATLVLGLIWFWYYGRQLL